MCSVSGCIRPTRAKDLCAMHYKRWWKYGDPEIIFRAPPGEPQRYLLEHMYDGCCYPWPYGKRNGYPEVTDNDGRPRGGHNKVCEMVNGPPLDGEVTRHKCGKGHLGCFNADCLEWGYPQENVQDSIKHGTWVHGEYHGCTKLSTRVIEKLRKMYATGNYTHRGLAKIFDISKSQVSSIVNFKKRRNG